MKTLSLRKSISKGITLCATGAYTVADATHTGTTATGASITVIDVVSWGTETAGPGVGSSALKTVADISAF